MENRAYVTVTIETANEETKQLIAGVIQKKLCELPQYIRDLFSVEEAVMDNVIRLFVGQGYEDILSGEG